MSCPPRRAVTQLARQSLLLDAQVWITKDLTQFQIKLWEVKKACTKPPGA